VIADIAQAAQLAMLATAEIQAVQLRRLAEGGL
jgi:hypothetical protein